MENEDLRNRRFAILVYSCLALASIISYQNCGQGFQSKGGASAPSRTTQCKASNGTIQSFKVEPPASPNRVCLFENDNCSILDGSISTKATDQAIAAGKELVFSVDEECLKSLRDLGSIVDPFTPLILISGLPGYVSHTIASPVDTTISELENLTSSVPCIRGIGENARMKPFFPMNDPNKSSQFHVLPTPPPPGAPLPTPPPPYSGGGLDLSAALDIFYSPTKGITQDVVLAVIDSGVLINHPDLNSNIWTNPGETGLDSQGNNKATNGIDDDSNGIIDDVQGAKFLCAPPNANSNCPILSTGDPNPQAWPPPDAGEEGHGTHVAGLAAAAINNGVGVVGIDGKHVKIMALNVFGPTAGTSTDQIDAAISYATRMGANVINMSLGGPVRAPSSTSRKLIEDAIAAGVVVVMAAGNDSREVDHVICGSVSPDDGHNGKPDCIVSPGGIGRDVGGAITIGASDAKDNSFCSFSNFSTSFVELAAPGCAFGGAQQHLLSTWIDISVPADGIGDYAFLAGTSMSSPVAAGSAALAYGLILSRKGVRPHPADIEVLLQGSSNKDPAYGGVVKGGYRLDLVNLAKKTNDFIDTGFLPCP